MKARVRDSGTYFYYFDGKKEIPLGKDYVDAVRKWAALEKNDAPIAAVVTFRSVAEKYLLGESFKRLAPRTQSDYLHDLKKLYEFFDNPPAPLDAIKSKHIAIYRDWRKVTHSTQELALFSSIWNWGKERGYTDQPNPATKVERNRSKGRTVFVTDDMFSAVYKHADQPLRDAMDLAHLAGQRPGDSLRFMVADIKDGALHVRQGKTKMPVRIEIIGKLKEVIDRITARKAALKVKSFSLVVNERGQALTASALDGRFGKAREAAKIGTMEFQFRDLRAKAATEIDEERGTEAAQRLLGHEKASTTQGYIRHRLGRLVKPAR